jgi:hypothetical protein
MKQIKDINQKDEGSLGREEVLGRCSALCVESLASPGYSVSVHLTLDSLKKLKKLIKSVFRLQESKGIFLLFLLDTRRGFFCY